MPTSSFRSHASLVRFAAVLILAVLSPADPARAASWQLLSSGATGNVPAMPSYPLPSGPAVFAPCGVFQEFDQQLLEFGGVASGVPTGELDALATTFPAWSATPAIGPAARHSATAIFEAGRNRTIVFGGRSGDVWFDDLWEVTKGNGPLTAQRLLAVGTPGPRAAHVAVFEPAGSRMIVFGGEGPDGLLGDLWSFSTATHTWTPITALGTPPRARSGASAIYDPVRRRMLLFGGFDGAEKNDVWSLSLDGTPTWNELAPSGAPPLPRDHHSAVYDPWFDRMVVFGGRDGSQFFSDASTLTLHATPAWGHPFTGATAARAGHVAVVDTWNRRMFVTGGTGTGGDLGTTAVLRLDATPSWSSSIPVPTIAGSVYQPAPDGSGSAFDSRRGRLYGFTGGGLDLYTSVFNPGWIYVPGAGGTTPPYREGCAAVYDSYSDRMVMFGGTLLGGTTPLDEVWVKPAGGMGSWMRLAPLGPTPGGRSRAALLDDPIRHRVLLFGGTASGVLFSDVWALSMDGPPQWSLVTTAGSPPEGRYGMSVVYDAHQDRLVSFGGTSTLATYLHEVWTLTLSGTPTWTRLFPDPLGAMPRRYASAIYDSRRDRLVVWGGEMSEPYQTAVMALNLSGTPGWSTVPVSGSVPRARADAATGYDPRSDLMVVGGGGVGTSVSMDTWGLAFGGTGTTAVDDPAGTSRLAVVALLRSAGVVQAIVSVPSPDAATLELFDLAGRRVATTRFAGTAGTRQLTLATDRALPAGVFFTRITQGAHTATRRAALLR